MSLVYQPVAVPRQLSFDDFIRDTLTVVYSAYYIDSDGATTYRQTFRYYANDASEYRASLDAQLRTPRGYRFSHIVKE